LTRMAIPGEFEPQIFTDETRMARLHCAIIAFLKKPAPSRVLNVESPTNGPMIRVSSVSIGGQIAYGFR
jgi:hypothetical protein